MATNWRIAIAAAVFALICLTACGTLNRGTTTNPDRGPVIRDVQLTADNWNATLPAMISVSWTEGIAPYTISIDVGTRESVAAGTEAGTSPFSWEFTLEEGTSFNYIVTVADSLGRSGTKTGTYGPVSTAPLPLAPTIENVEYDPDTCKLTVEVFDGDYDDVTVQVTDIDGLIVDTNTQTVPEGYGTVVFQWSAENTFLGGSGTTTVTASQIDSGGTGDSADVVITVPPIELDLEEGRLAVIPLEISAAVGDTVTIMVVTGPFPATAPFAYMNGVGVTVTDGGDYVDGTFNVGALGGGFRDVDGIWAEMDPSPLTFFVPEDFMMHATDVTLDPTLDFMGFNVTPIGAGEVTCGGFLFNFGISFDAPGSYVLDYIEFQDVKRTYYSDINGVEYNWETIVNGLAILTSITVN